MKRMIFTVLIALLVCVFPANSQTATPTVTTKADSAQTLPKLKVGTVYAPELKIPSNALHQFNEGNKDYNASRYEEAAEHFKLASRMYPKYSRAYASLAMALLRINRFGESHKAIEVAIGLDKNSVDAVLALGVLYFRESKYSESEAQLQRVVAVLPHEPSARQVLSAIAVLRSDYTEVIKQTDAIEEKDAAQHSIAFVIRGVALEKLGFVGEADACYERYLHFGRKGRKKLEEARAAILQLSAGTNEDKMEAAN